MRKNENNTIIIFAGHYVINLATILMFSFISFVQISIQIDIECPFFVARSIGTIYINFILTLSFIGICKKYVFNMWIFETMINTRIYVKSPPSSLLFLEANPFVIMLYNQIIISYGTG